MEHGGHVYAFLGVQPQRGRFYTHAEDRPGDARHVAVIDHGFWQSEYGGGADVLGRRVFVNDIAYTIIGVAPPGFTGPELKSISIWLPLSTGYEPRPDWPTTWQAQWLRVIARTRTGISAEAAAGAATMAYRAAAAGHSTRAVQGTVSLLPLNYGPAGEEPAEASVTRWLFGVSLILLLIATANVVNMLLARVLRRRREMSIRLALGISRARLVRLLISESLLLAFAGLAGALALAYWGGRAVRLALLPDVQWGTPVGGRMLLFAAAAALVTGAMVSVAPALHSKRYNLMGGLRSSSVDIPGGRSPLRAALIVVQMASSVVLLVGAGLFIRSLWNVSRLDLGIDADRVLAAWVTLDETTQRDAFFREAIARLKSHADVDDAVLALGTPLQG
ncbi:MAG: ABC transporter permease, partial [Longimicrobiales bacterium]